MSTQFFDDLEVIYGKIVTGTATNDDWRTYYVNRSWSCIGGLLYDRVHIGRLMTMEEHEKCASIMGWPTIDLYGGYVRTIDDP